VHSFSQLPSRRCRVTSRPQLHRQRRANGGGQRLGRQPEHSRQLIVTIAAVAIARELAGCGRQPAQRLHVWVRGAKAAGDPVTAEQMRALFGCGLGTVG